MESWVTSCLLSRVFRYGDKEYLSQIPLTFQAQYILSLLSSNAVSFVNLCGEQYNNQLLTSNYALPFTKKLIFLNNTSWKQRALWLSLKERRKQWNPTQISSDH